MRLFDFVNNKVEMKLAISNKVVDLGIEYAHIYVDRHFSDEQAKSITLLKDIEKSVKYKDTSRIILVDDYSPNISFDKFDFQEFINELKNLNSEPDVVVAESELVEYCKVTLSSIRDKRTRKSVSNYVDANQKYPCSLFIASWYLLRLGVYGDPQLRCLLGHQSQLLSKEIVTIVPSLYKSYEERALKIIEATDHSYLSKNIKQIFYEFPKKI